MRETNLAAVLPGMHVFYCVAKHLSFTEAAKDLYVTQGAVSHRVRQLEDFFGFALFHRYTRKIALTGEGEILFTIVSRAMHDLDNEINKIRHLGVTGSLVVTCPPSFANIWLVPRLAVFQQQYPGIVVHVRCRNDLVDLETEHVDVAVIYDAYPHQGMANISLMQETLFPVCSPEYAARFSLQQEGVAALAKCTLLHDNAPWPNAQYYSEWQAWVTYYDIKKLDTKTGYSFDRAELAIGSAKNHLGVAMGRGQLVQNDLDTGVLVAPFKEKMPSLQKYCAIVRKEDVERPRISAFIQWLLAETKGE